MLTYEQGLGIVVAVQPAALVCRYRVSPGRGFIRRSLKQPHRHLGEWCRLALVSAVTTVTIHPGDSLYFYLQWWRVDILSIVWPGVGSGQGADLEPGHHSGVAAVASGYPRWVLPPSYSCCSAASPGVAGVRCSLRHPHAHSRSLTVGS